MFELTEEEDQILLKCEKFLSDTFGVLVEDTVPSSHDINELIDRMIYDLRTLNDYIENGVELDD